MSKILTSSIILLAKTDNSNKYIFGAYKNDGTATSFLKLPEDHDFFVNTLTKKQTVMGRKTLEATPKEFPDAGRVCISHHPKKIREDAIPAASIPEAISIAKKRAEKANDQRIYIIGGATIIKQCIEENLLDEIKLTLAYSHKKQIQNPVFLDFKLDNWTTVSDSGLLISEKANPKFLKYRFLTLQTKRL